MPQESFRHFEGFRNTHKIEEGGVLNISGNFIKDHSDEILNLIKNESAVFEKKNAAHKILDIKKSDNSIVVDFTEHHLAMHVGKALVHAYKGEHEYKFLPGEKYVEVDWKRD